MQIELVSDTIFRGYDVRGVYGKTLDEEVMERIGQGFSSLTEGDTAVIARDGRVSGKSLSGAFARGIASTGKNVQDIGMVPLGVGMFHAWKLGRSFAFVTASHLDSDWNGLKFFWSKGIGFMEEELGRLKKACLSKPGKTGQGKVESLDSKSVIKGYIDHLQSRIKPSRPVSLALDPGNGVAGMVVRDLFSKAGFNVEVINENVDGRFLARSPDPLTDPLPGLCDKVNGRDLGIAYDGDGDRMVVLNELGERVTPEQLSYIMLSELLKEQKGPIIANVESTRAIDMIAEKFGRSVHRVRVGHNYLMKGAYDKKASFGMEPSGHYSVPSIFPFDDSLAISYYFACVVSRSKLGLSELVSEIPSLPFRRVNFDVPDEKKFRVMDQVREELRKAYPNINTMDGVRVDFANGWALIRPSNTQPMIRLTVEARTRAGLKEIMEGFSAILKRYINP
jgi:phosphomannomutase